MIVLNDILLNNEARMRFAERVVLTFQWIHTGIITANITEEVSKYGRFNFIHKDDKVEVDGTASMDVLYLPFLFYYEVPLLCSH